MLLVRGSASGVTSEFLRYIDISPVAGRIDGFTRGIRAEGNGRLNVSLAIPLRHSQDAKIEGDFTFSGNRLLIDDDVPPLTDAAGKIAFTESALTVRGAQATALGFPMTLDVASAGGGVVNVTASGRASMDALRTQLGQPWLAALAGTAAWQARLGVRRNGMDITLDADLSQLTSTLPAPLGKAPGEPMALRIERIGTLDPRESARRGLPAIGPDRELLHITLGELASADIVRRATPTGWVIDRGAIGLPQQPAMPERGLALSLRADTLDLDALRRAFVPRPATEGTVGVASSGDADLPLARLLRLALFQVSVGMTIVLLNGTLNRVMIVELGTPAWLVAPMIALPVLIAPFRALIGHRSDTHRSVLGWRRVPYIWFGTLMQFGGLKALNQVDLTVRRGTIHGLIGPNGSGKTTTLNVISGYYSPNQGTMTFGQTALPSGLPHLRASRGIARTFQTPRIVGEISVLENVMIGGATKGKASFLESLLAMPKEKTERNALKERARALLAVVGLGSLAHVRTDRLQHSELRFIEIARALMIAPDFLMLDEPAAGLSSDEINKLGELIQAISACGTGVLLVEHHVDLIFAICDDVTVLNLGKILAAGTPDEIRAHKEVVNAYLGG